MRCVIVVPGRGRNSPDGIGILREKLKLWFTQEPFKRVVLAFCTARPHDGGPGSLYVLLRKYKKIVVCAARGRSCSRMARPGRAQPKRSAHCRSRNMPREFFVS